MFGCDTVSVMSNEQSANGNADGARGGARTVGSMVNHDHASRITVSSDRDGCETSLRVSSGLVVSAIPASLASDHLRVQHSMVPVCCLPEVRETVTLRSGAGGTGVQLHRGVGTVMGKCNKYIH